MLDDRTYIYTCTTVHGSHRCRNNGTEFKLGEAPRARPDGTQFGPKCSKCGQPMKYLQNRTEALWTSTRKTS